jgi:hypothetical protein
MRHAPPQGVRNRRRQFGHAVSFQQLSQRAHRASQWLRTITKEMTQSRLVCMLCTGTAPNPTRRAIFGVDKLIRNIYTLRYLCNPQLETKSSSATSAHMETTHYIFFRLLTRTLRIYRPFYAC